MGGGFSAMHWLIVLVVVMLLFGAGRVSEIGKGLGEGIRNFKKGLKDADDDGRDVVVRAKPADAEPAQLTGKKKKIIQVEVDEDEDEAAALRRVAEQKNASGAHGEKS